MAFAVVEMQAGLVKNSDQIHIHGFVHLVDGIFPIDSDTRILFRFNHIDWEGNPIGPVMCFDVERSYKMIVGRYF